MGIAVGIGTPLLFMIFFLVVALVYTIKRNQRKSINEVSPTMSTQMTNNMRVMETSCHVVKGSTKKSPSPNIYDNDNIYSAVDDEGKVVDDDEYVDVAAGTM